MALSFRTARKLWMGVVALVSLTCIFLAVVLWVHGYSKSNNFGALIAIPCFTFVGAIWTWVPPPTLPVVSFVYIFLKKDSQEDVLLPTNRLYRGNMGFHPPSVSDTQVSSCNTNQSITSQLKLLQVFIYAAGIILLALLTQFSCDQEIWARDIDSSPCPFPFPVLLVYAFPFAAQYFRGTVAESREAAVDYCLPGCPCHAKPTEALSLGVENADYTEGTQSSIPIRVPTAMERHNAIRVTLGYMAR
ncbi:hypothetical protein J3R82DRAFT_4295 [Butyriboletus roseoflavus]|nr:hypothetical protein J3R82DRAFT_4295 [Butyriboletus roseoflavus]